MGCAITYSFASGQSPLPNEVLEEIRAGEPSHVSASLTDRPQPTNMEMRERMSGNICRCGAYSNIAEAMAEVAGARA